MGKGQSWGQYFVRTHNSKKKSEDAMGV